MIQNKRAALVAAVVSTLAGGAMGLALPIAGTGVAAAAPAVACHAAGNSGLTASVVATKGQTIAGANVNATGCDVGIFVGKGVTGVTIKGATVTGAADQGILALDTSG
ncbi:MAG: hypothetical protein ACRDZY_21465, partial [Acidimicrobiales bacterium]